MINLWEKQTNMQVISSSKILRSTSIFQNYFDFVNSLESFSTLFV